MASSRTTTIGRTVEQIGVKGQGNALIINNDLVNPLYVSQSNVISANDLTVPPLGTMGIDGSSNWYASTLASYGIAVGIAPGITSWNPSPAQVAAQISALGLATASNQTTGIAAVNGVNTSVGGVNTSVGNVNTTLGSPAQDSIRTAIPANIGTTGAPPLSKSTLLNNSGSLSLAANGNTVSSSFSLNQPSFELYLKTQYTSTNGTNPYIFVIINWFDSNTSSLIDKETFVTGIGSSAGAQITTRIKGPTRGDTAQIKIYNLDTLEPITYSWVLLASSRFVFSEQIDWVMDNLENTFLLPGHTVCATPLPDSRTIGVHVNASLAVNATDGIVFPPHAGNAYLYIFETGVGAANMSVSMQPVPTSIYVGTPWLFNDLMNTGNPNEFSKQLNLPNAPVQINIKNGGSVAANYTMILVTGQTY